MGDQIKRKYSRIMVIGGVIMLIGIAIMVIFPILFTQYSGRYDFTETGQIGDTIGGITAPIAAIIGAVLLFISFLEQWKANQIQTNSILNNRRFEILEKSVKELSKLFKEDFKGGHDKYSLFLRKKADGEFESYYSNNETAFYKSLNCLDQFVSIYNQIIDAKELHWEQTIFFKDQIFPIILDNFYSKDFAAFKEKIIETFLKDDITDADKVVFLIRYKNRIEEIFHIVGLEKNRFDKYQFSAT